MSELDIEKVGKPEIDKYNQQLEREKNTFGWTYNRQGRIVHLSLNNFRNMQKNGTLPKKKDWINFVDFTPFTQEELDEITEKNQNGLNSPTGETSKKAEAKKAPAEAKPKADAKAKAKADTDADEEVKAVADAKAPVNEPAQAEVNEPAQAEVKTPAPATNTLAGNVPEDDPFKS